MYTNKFSDEFKSLCLEQCVRDTVNFYVACVMLGLVTCVRSTGFINMYEM